MSPCAAPAGKQPETNMAYFNKPLFIKQELREPVYTACNLWLGRPRAQLPALVPFLTQLSLAPAPWHRDSTGTDDRSCPLPRPGHRQGSDCVHNGGAALAGPRDVGISKAAFAMGHAGFKS